MIFQVIVLIIGYFFSLIVYYKQTYKQSNTDSNYGKEYLIRSNAKSMVVFRFYRFSAFFSVSKTCFFLPQSWQYLLFLLGLISIFKMRISQKKSFFFAHLKHSYKNTHYLPISYTYTLKPSFILLPHTSETNTSLYLSILVVHE